MPSLSEHVLIGHELRTAAERLAWVSALVEQEAVSACRRRGAMRALGAFVQEIGADLVTATWLDDYEEEKW